MPARAVAQRAGPPQRAGRWSGSGATTCAFAEGAIPRVWDGSGANNSRTTLWMRDEPAAPLDFHQPGALCDVFFPRVWLRRATRVPAGTVSMTVYFHAGRRELAAVGTAGCWARRASKAFRNGFFDQTAQLWSEAGRAAGSSHQVVYYKE
jgi:hypothetical protein